MDIQQRRAGERRRWATQDLGRHGSVSLSDRPSGARDDEVWTNNSVPEDSLGRCYLITVAVRWTLFPFSLTSCLLCSVSIL